MSTVDQLINKFGPAIPLKDVCELYFGISTYKEACRKAAVNQLPVPTFKLRQSERAPYLVDPADLAQHIEKTKAASVADWQHCQA